MGHHVIHGLTSVTALLSNSKQRRRLFAVKSSKILFCCAQLSNSRYIFIHTVIMPCHSAENFNANSQLYRIYYKQVSLYTERSPRILALPLYSPYKRHV